jgi:hypothetical protein
MVSVGCFLQLRALQPTCNHAAAIWGLVINFLLNGRVARFPVVIKAATYDF